MDLPLSLPCAVVRAGSGSRYAADDALGVEDLGGKVDVALAFALVHERVCASSTGRSP
jgi:hypothetical protein